jgi:D-alanine-D-alanine ligase-like ATP-grasp enzyme
MKKPFVSELLLRIAKKSGAVIHLEPRYRFAGQIVYRNGRIRYFRYQHMDLNPLGASEIASDKDFASYFMQHMGYPVIEGRTFFSKRRAASIKSKQTVDTAYQYAKQLGFPVIVKPNSKSQGSGVCKVWTKQQLYQAARHIFRKDPIMLVQRCVKGQDYRIVVLDREVISAYERIPLAVVGDGRTTILELMKRKQRVFKRAGRDTAIPLDDFRIALRLGHLKLGLRSIPERGQEVALLDIANLSTGGSARDVTKIIHPSIRRLAVQLTKDMGLRLCGVDLMIEGKINVPLDRYHVIEVNAAPGLDHYASTGERQAAAVERLYIKVLRALQRER